MIWALILYLLLHLAICLGVSQWVSTEADYLLAGRRLGLVVASLSMFANWFGAEVLMSSTGLIAAHGLSGGRADPFGYTLCLVGMGLLLAGEFRKREYVTVGDFFADHYGRTNEVVASVILVLTMLLMATAGIQAFGWVLTTLTPLNIEQTLPIAVAVVIAYTWIGGMLGDVVSDVIQGTVLIVGLMLLLGTMITLTGGWEHAFAHVTPQQWSMLRPDEHVLNQLDVWLIPILGSMVAPEALTRTLSADSAATARKACYWGGLIYLLVGCMVVGIALAGAPLVGPLTETDQFLPTLVAKVLPPWMGVVVLGALVSAILSTIDTTLLSIGGMVSHNILVPIQASLQHQPLTEAAKVRLARWVVMASGIVAYGISLTSGRSIYSLVELASSFGSAGFLVCVLGGLYLPGISPFGALSILLLGVAQTLAYDFWLHLDGSFVLSLIGCSSLYLTLWLVARRQTNAQPA